MTFVEIEENVYVISEPERDCASPCGCRGIKCDDYCLNYSMQMECGPSCQFGDNCVNKRFQFRRYAPLELLDSPPKGKGVFAKEAIDAGAFVVEYVGEVL